MSLVEYFKCNGCGREVPATGEWATVVAMIVRRPPGETEILQKHEQHIDLCSRECAAKWLFG